MLLQYFYHQPVSVLWSDEAFFPHLRQRGRAGVIWGAWELLGMGRVNKVVLNLPVRISNTHHYQHTYIYLSGLLPKWRRIWAHPPHVAIFFICTHGPLPHVSGNEREGLRIHWKVGCRVKLEYYCCDVIPYTHTSLISQHNFYYLIMSVLYSVVRRWTEISKTLHFPKFQNASIMVHYPAIAFHLPDLVHNA